MKSLACLFLLGTVCWLLLLPVDGWIKPIMISRHCNYSNVNGHKLKCCYRKNRDRWYCTDRKCPNPRNPNQTSFEYGSPKEDRSCFTYYEGFKHCVEQFAYQCSGGPAPGPQPACLKFCHLN